MLRHLVAAVCILGLTGCDGSGRSLGRRAKDAALAARCGAYQEKVLMRQVDRGVGRIAELGAIRAALTAEPESSFDVTADWIRLTWTGRDDWDNQTILATRGEGGWTVEATSRLTRQSSLALPGVVNLPPKPRPGVPPFGPLIRTRPEPMAGRLAQALDKLLQDPCLDQEPEHRELSFTCYDGSAGLLESRRRFRARFRGGCLAPDRTAAVMDLLRKAAPLRPAQP